MSRYQPFTVPAATGTGRSDSKRTGPSTSIFTVDTTFIASSGGTQGPPVELQPLQLDSTTSMPRFPASWMA